MVTALKVILTIILIPLKIVFFVFAYAVRVLTYLLYFVLILIATPIATIKAIITPIFSFSAIGVTVYLINQISSESMEFSQGMTVIVSIWLFLLLFEIILFAIEKICEGLLSFGSLMTDWAKANWFD